MKRFVLAGLLAAAALAVSQQQASAWINSRFSIGLNWGWQSGGNNFVWGAFKNGQPPGPEAFGGGSYAPSYAPSFPPMPQATPQAYYYYAPMPHANPVQNAQQVQPAYGPYQFATYPRPVYYYPQPSFYFYHAD